MVTVLFLMVEWHIGGCDLHGYSLVSNGRVAYRWLWSAWLHNIVVCVFCFKCFGCLFFCVFFMSSGETFYLDQLLLLLDTTHINT